MFQFSLRPIVEIDLNHMSLYKILVFTLIYTVELGIQDVYSTHAMTDISTDIDLYVTLFTYSYTFSTFNLTSERKTKCSVFI